MPSAMNKQNGRCPNLIGLFGTTVYLEGRIAHSERTIVASASRFSILKPRLSPGY